MPVDLSNLVAFHKFNAPGLRTLREVLDNDTKTRKMYLNELGVKKVNQ